MGAKTLFLTDPLYDYMCRIGAPEPDALRELREQATAEDPTRTRHGAPDQVQFLAWLVRVTGARRVLEMGTYLGYASLGLALALPPEGRLVTCDVEDTHARLGRPHWTKAGVADRIDFRVAPAMSVLDGLLAESGADSFDFAFLDADKVNHDAYYERCLRLVRSGGVIVLNNVFCRELSALGTAADPTLDADGIAYVEAVQALNIKVARDERVIAITVPLGDGITLAHVR